MHLYCEDDQTLRQMTQRFWSLHSWRDSKLNETQYWASCFNWPCSEKIGPGISPEVSSNLNQPVWFYVWASFDTTLSNNVWPLLEMTHHVGATSQIQMVWKEAGSTDIFFPLIYVTLGQTWISSGCWLHAAQAAHLCLRLRHELRKVVFRQKETGTSICEGNEPAMTADIQTAPCPGCRLNTCTKCLEQSNQISCLSRSTFLLSQSRASPGKHSYLSSQECPHISLLAIYVV